MANTKKKFDPRRPGIRLASSFIAMAGAIAFANVYAQGSEDPETTEKVVSEASELADSEASELDVSQVTEPDVSEAVEPEDSEVTELEVSEEVEPEVSEDTRPEVEEIVVKGMRQALMNAQDIKRNASTVIESITAEDLGSFPDKSIAEALQRISGITVNRFAATGDTAHFSAEPSGVVVRGLNQVRTEFNGRDSFSANSSRGLSWTDVSPELMSGVDTYKNQMAELIEGGLAGTVNMRTRVPFDQDGQMAVLTLGANYGDLSEETTPEVSGLYSNRWETGIGELGFLANFAFSEVKTRTDGNQLYRMNRFQDIYQPDTLNFIPATIAMRENLYDRDRKGIALAAQWQDLDEKLVTTFQFNRSEYENAWEEYVMSVSPADLSYGQSVFYNVPDGVTPPQPAPGTPDFTFDENGLFQTGVMTADIGWWGGNPEESAAIGANSAGEPMVNPCYGWNGCEPPRRGVDMGTTTRSANTLNMTQDFGVNVKWDPTDSMRANFDAQYVDSEVDAYDIEVAYSSFANAGVDLTGERPALDLRAPLNVNQSPGGLANPNNYYIRSIMDHIEDSDGTEVALKADFEFDLDSGWMESVKVGARYADREQDVRWSGYNWQNVANTWSGNQAPYFNLDRHDPDTTAGTGFRGYPDNHYVNRTLDSDYLDISQDQFVFANVDLMANKARMDSAMSATALGLSNTGWDPICSNVGDRAGEIPGTCFTPAEVANVQEVTNAAYVQLNFGGVDTEMFGIPYSGNIGVRYVETKDTSVGGYAYPDNDFAYVAGQPHTFENLLCEQIESTDPETPPPPVPQTLECYISRGDHDFANSGTEANTAVTNHTNVLPSFNIKFDFTDEWLMRIALSKAMSRPDMGNLRNYTGIGATRPEEDNAEDPLWIKNGSGEITGANVRYSASSHNPALAPITALQGDISFEYYFADVGYVTLGLFAKDFEDYIQYTTVFEDFTNNGVTKTAEVRRPINGDGAKLQGFELSFQRYMDFLPEPFDGLGLQANYTYIDNKGISNTNVSNVGDGSTDVEAAAPDQVNVNKLEGLSDRSYNLVGLYEKGRFAARLAYSWRSEFLVTAIDCCVLMPIWNEASGQLDGSISYDISDNMKLRFQGSNLLNEKTVLRQQVTNEEDGAKLMPNAWFQNDVRYTLSLSIQY